MKTLFLVIGSSGEYSDRIEWPVALYETEETARAAAEGAKRIALTNQNLRLRWHRYVNDPWIASNPFPRYGRPTIEGWRQLSDAHEAARPKRPEFRNPFDPAPDHGDGDEYRVEPVPLLTELPADSPEEL